MKRVSRNVAAAVLLAGLSGLGMAGWSTPAAAVVDANLGPQEREVLGKAEQALNSIDTLQARFLQLASTGNSVEGEVYMDRPGKMRLEYDTAPILMVANGRHLIYVDKELDQVSYLGLSQTPVGVLLRQNVSFGDPDITVTDVRRKDGVAEIDVVQTEDRGSGTLTLVFTENPFELRQWRVVDAQNTQTAVSLYNTRTGMALPQDLFEYSRPVDPTNPMGRN
ncbi:Outer membrane lipoprotein carrier protein LolA [Caenispirillum salinarum AK4]|uniref:Outer membrane lipoprotein carrier protein LolA n=1 Tax=Caenispirillum salinarum AK4 TaxID=1238182 RepID=K9H511_9PROT|nr:outer membrane lipoprotein carrier protein LolA [Caenispirillum salinarum]EKV32139.1 Outer membrane lipoprotein carrier protein LolA [Caenispirillum salinarum AK4]